MRKKEKLGGDVNGNVFRNYSANASCLFKSFWCWIFLMAEFWPLPLYEGNCLKCFTFEALFWGFVTFSTPVDSTNNIVLFRIVIISRFVNKPLVNVYRPQSRMLTRQAVQWPRYFLISNMLGLETADIIFQIFRTLFRKTSKCRFILNFFNFVETFSNIQ